MVLEIAFCLPFSGLVTQLSCPLLTLRVTYRPALTCLNGKCARLLSLTLRVNEIVMPFCFHSRHDADRVPRRIVYRCHCSVQAENRPLDRFSGNPQTVRCHVTVDTILGAAGSLSISVPLAAGLPVLPRCQLLRCHIDEKLCSSAVEPCYTSPHERAVSTSKSG